MKMKRMFKIILCALTCFLVAENSQVLSVRAGASNIITDGSSFREQLDTSLWNNLNSDIQIQNGTLIFPDNSTGGTSLISKVNAKKSDMHKELISAQLTMQLTRLPKKEAFVIAFGLGGTEAMLGEPGNVESTFTNKDGLKVAVVAYDMDGKKVQVQKAVAAGSVGSSLKIQAVISTKEVLTLRINGREICNKKLPISGEGRFGFLQTGSCGAKVTDFRLVSHEYDRPENCNVVEDFEKETINVNALTSRMVIPSTRYVPSGAVREVVDGNGVFTFKNSGSTYLGSMYPYSNFELTFDVLYLQRSSEMDKDGKIIKPKSENFAVSFGDETADFSGNGYDNSTDLLIFSGNSTVTSWHTGKYESAADKGYPFYDKACDKPFSVKVSMIDSVATVEIKWLNEKKYTKIMQYQVSEKTPTGYVHIWTTADVANMSIDNLRITNKDEKPNLIKVDYKSGLIEKPEDYVFERMERVYKEPEKEEETENPYRVVLYVAIGCVLIFGLNLIIVCLRRKKGGAKDEEKMEEA